MSRRLTAPVTGLLLLMVAMIFAANSVVREIFPLFAAPEPLAWEAEWLKAPEPGHQAFFRRTFDLPFQPEQAWIAVSSNDHVLYVNGAMVARNRYVNNIGQAFQSRGSQRSQAIYRNVAALSRAPELRRSPNQEKLTPYFSDISGALRPGRNVIAIAIEDTHTAPSFSTSGEIIGKTRTMSLDSRTEDWRASTLPSRINGQDWKRTQIDNDGWAQSIVSGETLQLFTANDPLIWSAPTPSALMTGPTNGQTATFRTTLSDMGWHGIDRGAWMRISSNWAYTILIDGRTFTGGSPSRSLRAHEITAFLDKPESTITVRLDLPPRLGENGEPPYLAVDFILDGRHVTGIEKWSALKEPGADAERGPWGPVTVARAPAVIYAVGLVDRIRPLDWSVRYWSIWAALLAGSLALWAALAALVGPVARSLSIVPGRLSGAILAIPAIAALLVTTMRLRYKESDTILWFYEPGNAALLAAGVVASFGIATLLMTTRLSPTGARSVSFAIGAEQGRTLSTILLIAILALGTYLRMLGVGLEDLQADENVSLDAARGIVRTGLPEAVSGVLYTRSPLYHYLLAGWLILFGDTPEVARSFSVLAGVGTIAAAYWFALLMGTGRVLALVIALWLAVDSWMIVVSLNIRFYQQMQFFGLLSFSLFLKGFVFGRNRRTQFWFFVCLTAATLSQEVFVTMFPGLCIAGYFYYRPFRLSEDWTIILGTFTVLAITIVDIAIFQIMCLTQHVNIGTTSGSILQLHTLEMFAFTSSFLSGTLRSNFFVTVLLIAALIMRPRTSSPAVGVGIVLLIVGMIVATILVVQVANRYLFVLKPVLMITVVAAVREIVIDWSERLFAGPEGAVLRRRWQGMVCALLIAAGVADTEVWRTLTSYGHVTILQHQGAYAYIAENMRPGDKVVSVSPMSAAIVLGQLDYYLMETIYFDEIYVHREAGIIDRWSGGHLISNVERLRQVFLENERVWVMVNIQEGPRFSGELLGYLTATTEVQKTFFGGEVHLWDRSRAMHVPLANRNRDLVSF